MERQQKDPRIAQVAVPCAQEAFPTARDHGYLDGQQCRLRGAMLTAYTRTGIDDYALGFRAGYYGRIHPQAAQRGLRHVAANADTSVPQTQLEGGLEAA